MANGQATNQRAGVNLREFGLSMLNRFDDRMYFATDSGMVVCLREIGATQPRLLRDPKALPVRLHSARGHQEDARARARAGDAGRARRRAKGADADKPKTKDAKHAPPPDAKEKPAEEPKDEEPPK